MSVNISKWNFVISIFVIDEIICNTLLYRRWSLSTEILNSELFGFICNKNFFLKIKILDSQSGLRKWAIRKPVPIWHTYWTVWSEFFSFIISRCDVTNKNMRNKIYVINLKKLLKIIFSEETYAIARCDVHKKNIRYQLFFHRFQNELDIMFGTRLVYKSSWKLNELDCIQ